MDWKQAFFFFFLDRGRGMNPGSCIHYVLFCQELSLREHWKQAYDNAALVNK